MTVCEDTFICQFLKQPLALIHEQELFFQHINTLLDKLDDAPKDLFLHISELHQV